MAEFDPSTANVDEVLKKLEKADGAERDRILAAESSGKHRATILKEYGVDPDARVDATGRELYPWETDPKDQDTEAGARQAESQDEGVATEQPSSTAPGVGVTGSPAPGGTVNP